MVGQQEKAKPISRLKTMLPLRAKMDASYQKSIEDAEKGKPIVWSMSNNWRSELIFKAMDVEVLYTENYGGAAAGLGAAEPYLRRCDEEGFPAHLCGYARNTIGYTARMMKDLGGEIPPEAPMGGLPKPVLLMGGTAGCDARYKWFQALGRYMDVPQWVMEYPQMGVRQSQAKGAYEAAINLMLEGLREFVTFVEHLLDRKMDWGKLEEVIHNAAEIARWLHEINELRKVKPCPMHARDYWAMVPACLFLVGDLKDTVDRLQDMYNEVKYRVDNGIGAVAQEKYRLLFADLPPWHSLRFFDGLAERGWNFVAESWGYHAPPPIDLGGIDDPLERIARLSYHKNYLPLVRAFEDGSGFSYGVQPLLDWARDFKCDGAMVHILHTCRTASCHLRAVQKELMRRLNVPSLEVEGDIVDLTLFNPADVFKKAEPFEEVMEHCRKVRREQGLDW